MQFKVVSVLTLALAVLTVGVGAAPVDASASSDPEPYSALSRHGGHHDHQGPPSRDHYSHNFKNEPSKYGGPFEKREDQSHGDAVHEHPDHVHEGPAPPLEARTVVGPGEDQQADPMHKCPRCHRRPPGDEDLAEGSDAPLEARNVPGEDLQDDVRWRYPVCIHHRCYVRPPGDEVLAEGSDAPLEARNVPGEDLQDDVRWRYPVCIHHRCYVRPPNEEPEPLPTTVLMARSAADTDAQLVRKDLALW